MKHIRPFLKWAGGKHRCLDTLLLNFPKGQRLIEPFTGSGAVFMNADYPRFLLAEQNTDLVHLFLQLQKEGEAFIDYCEKWFIPANNMAAPYYDYRDKFNACMNNKRLRAALFLYLNRHGYNGLCRYNSTGGYNVPFGSYKKPYFPRREMLAFHQKSQLAVFNYADFRDTFKMAEPGDIIYCDPPYAPVDQETNFRSYTKEGFTEADQIELADLAKATAARGIPVIISNHDTAFTRKHYASSNIHSFQVNRHIHFNWEKRKPIQELLAIFS